MILKVNYKNHNPTKIKEFMDVSWVEANIAKYSCSRITQCKKRDIPNNVFDTLKPDLWLENFDNMDLNDVVNVNHVIIRLTNGEEKSFIFVGLTVFIMNDQGQTIDKLV